MSQVAFLDRSFVMSQNYNKSNLKLDLNDGVGNSRKRSFLNVASSPAILASPDLKLLKLGSPELEKLIINTGGFIPTPTPSGLTVGSSNAHNEHGGTEDQESFLARGFIEALQRLQQQDGPGILSAPTTKQWTVPSVQVTNDLTSIPTSKVETSRWPQSNSVSVITPTNPNQPRLPEITAPSTINLPISSTGTVSTMGMTAIPRNSTSYVTRPTEVTNQTLSFSSGLNLPSQVASSTLMDTNLIKSEDESIDQDDDLDLDMNPIDLEMQEHIKHQRKKLRNRLAAQRCRRRKIEREDTLKVKVKELKNKNSELTALASQLRMQVCDLKQKVMLHVNEGCQVFLKEDEKSMSAKGL